MSEVITLEALSVASLAHQLAELDHETRATVVATENGTPWARLDVSPMTDTHRAVFPLDANGVRGDTSKRGQAGVMATARDGFSALSVVIERARRMGRAS